MDGRLGRRRGRGLGPAARVAVSLAAVALLLGAGGCGGEGEESTSGGRRVVVLGAESLAHLPVWVGMDRGIFAQYGFEVEWRVVTDDAERLAKVCGGRAHAATVDLFTVVRAAARGRKCFAWAGNPVVMPGEVAVVARAGADTLAGLKGKRVGAAPGTPAEVVLRVLLRAAGIDPRAAVTLVPIDEEALVAGLKGGAVDAVAVSGAAVTDALAVPGGRRSPATPTPRSTPRTA